MKRGIIILLSIILLSSFISADIIFTQTPKSIYNLGDSIFVPVTIKTSHYISGVFQMDLICNSTPINFYKNGIQLNSGEEISLDSSLVLIRNIIGNDKGKCKIKAILDGEYVLTDEFKISDSLNVESTIEKTGFDSGESIYIEGEVTKENSENSDGFVDVELVGKDIYYSGSVNDGTFEINISLPEELEAGDYTLQIKAYEEDSDGIETNNGISEHEIYVRQVPTNLELVFEDKNILPGTSLKFKTVLHDQTGEHIDSTAIITIKDSSDKIVEQEEINTDEFFEYSIKSDEPPSKWKVFAVSNKLTTEKEFNIEEKKEVDIEITNKTILITNIGNVPYNNTLLVKVENTSLNINVILKVGEEKKYVLSAPDGEYEVKISDNDKEINEIMSLTGKTVGIKEISASSLWVAFWIFLILILGFITFMFFKKMYKKPFFGKGSFFKKKTPKENRVKDMSHPKNGKAELSLSIKGDKQDASVICVKIKDLSEMKTKKGSASETMKKIINIAEENKAVAYENQDYLFFIIAPIKTKTFKNEKHALDTAKTIQETLMKHNKSFKQKIEFGISLNYGTIIAKIENGTFKFMSMGSLITTTKKIASLSNGEILLSDRINDLLRLRIKTERTEREGMNVYKIKEIKKENEEAKKFIERFVKGLEKEKKD